MSIAPEPVCNDGSTIDIKNLVAEVGAEVAAFQAQNLTQLKSDLEAFEKKRVDIVNGYRMKHADLLKRWNELTTEIESLHRQLKERFPNDSWKLNFTSCVCKRRAEIATLAKSLESRVTSFSGAAERKRDLMKAASDAAKSDLDTLIENAARIDTILSENKKRAADIRTLLGSPRGDAAAIYLLWGKVLPAHKRLRPDDGTDGLKFADGESPEELCTETAVNPSKRPAPWLINPDRYEAAISDAWKRYRQSRNELGEAESAYSAKPDAFASESARLQALQKGFDEDMRTCLACIQVEKPAPDAVPASDGDASPVDAANKKE